MLTPRMDLASQFKATRARLGLTQAEAAAVWQVNLRTLQGWESGRNTPRGPILNRLLPILFPAPAPAASARRRKRASKL